MVPTNYVINQATTYSFSVTLNDVISTAGCLVITFPSNISLSLSSCSAMGTNVNSTPNCTSSGSNTIFTVCNLFTSTFTVPNTVNITLNNGINPGSTQQTSNFSISSYYNSTGLVATGSILGFKPLPGTLNSNYVSISPSSNIVMASSVSYSIKFNNLNKISTNGILTIVFPTDITTGSLTSLNCQRSFNAGSFSATSCSGTSNSSGIYFTFSSIFTS